MVLFQTTSSVLPDPGHGPSTLHCIFNQICMTLILNPLFLSLVKNEETNEMEITLLYAMMHFSDECNNYQQSALILLKSRKVGVALQ